MSEKTEENCSNCGKLNDMCGVFLRKINLCDSCISTIFEIVVEKILVAKEEHICKCGRTYKAHFIDDSYKTCKYLNDSKPKETINHPEHYNMGKIEVIDFIEDQNLGFHLGNAVKYIARSEHKDNKKEDLKKAMWYLKRFLENRC